jgi:hypothetical protein
MNIQPNTTRSSPHHLAERIAVAEDQPSVGKELNEVFLGEPMGNRESKDASAHAARLAEAAQAAEIKPSAVAADFEEHKKAQAAGGQWMPHEIDSQKKQPEVMEAVRKAHEPAAKEKEALREAAQHQATGGRW